MHKFNFRQRGSGKNTILYLLIGLGLLFVFIYTIGFKLLLNTSVFIANKLSKETSNTLNKNTDIYTSLNIDDIPVATNSAKIIVSGSVVNFDSISFYINNELVKKQPITTTDVFNIEIGNLEPGENEVLVRATNKDAKDTKKSPKYIVVYKNEKPKLEISEPSDNSTVSTNEVSVKGSTDKEVLIKINDSPVVVDVNGNFDSNVRLQEGENTITITASDTAGNIETLSIKVIYQRED